MSWSCLPRGDEDVPGAVTVAEGLGPEHLDVARALSVPAGPARA